MILLLIIVCSLATVPLLPDWLSHISMVKGEDYPYGWATFKKFKHQFENHNMKEMELFDGSFRDKETKSYYHANIVRFDGKGMIINNPFSYFLVRQWVRENYTVKRKIRSSVKW